MLPESLASLGKVFRWLRKARGLLRLPGGGPEPGGKAALGPGHWRRLRLRCGRLRRLEWLLHLAVALVGGGLWFGTAGAALLGLWVYAWRPQAELVIAFPEPVRRLKLSRFAVTVHWGWRHARIFRDELEEQAYARLRRELKASLMRSPERA